MRGGSAGWRPRAANAQVRLNCHSGCDGRTTILPGLCQSTVLLTLSGSHLILVHAILQAPLPMLAVAAARRQATSLLRQRTRPSCTRPCRCGCRRQTVWPSGGAPDHCTAIACQMHRLATSLDGAARPDATDQAQLYALQCMTFEPESHLH